MLVGDWTGRALLFGSWTGRALLLGNWTSCALLLGDWTGRVLLLGHWTSRALLLENRTGRALLLGSWTGQALSLGNGSSSWAERVERTSSDSSSGVRSFPFVRSGVASLESLEASTSETLSGVPSSTDTKALRDLEVMRVCHDFDSIVIEGSLAAIRKHYSIQEEYAMHALLPE
ncbi:hypothetical protein GW17_00057760 [Ensete ventricosum]|nr:hypothetical protein GW17_00057760 [Ensete ventricosum]